MYPTLPMQLIQRRRKRCQGSSPPAERRADQGQQITAGQILHDQPAAGHCVQPTQEPDDAWALNLAEHGVLVPQHRLGAGMLAQVRPELLDGDPAAARIGGQCDFRDAPGAQPALMSIPWRWTHWLTMTHHRRRGSPGTVHRGLGQSARTSASASTSISVGSTGSLITSGSE